MDYQQSVFEQERNRIVRISGAEIEPEIVTILKKNWQQFMQEGVIVDVSLHRWRGETALSTLDLGISKNELSKLLKLGAKRLLPTILPDSPFYSDKKPDRTYNEALDSLESSTRAYYKKETLSYPTPWGYFLPVSTFKDCLEGLEEYKTRWYALRDDIAVSDERYEQIVEAVIEEYRVQAQNAWITAMKLDQERMQASEWAQMGQFVYDYLIRIRRLLPTRETFYKSFEFRISLNYIPLPSILADDLSKEQEVRRRAEIQAAQRQAEMDVIAAERRASMSVAQMKELQLREMNEEMVRQARAQSKEWVNEFVGNIASQIYDLFEEATTNAIDSINENGKLIGKNAEALRNMVDAVNKLNFADSQEIAKMTMPIRSALSAASGKRDIGTLQRSLADLRTVSRAAAYQIADLRGKRGEVNWKFDEPSFGAVRQARTNLELENNEMEEPSFFVIPQRQDRTQIKIEL